MSNIAAAWTNIATVVAGCTLTATSEASGMLVTKLQQEDTKRNYRSGAATSISITATYATNQSADTFFLTNTNLTTAGIARVRLRAADTSLVYDSNSGSVAGQVDPNYKDLVILAPSVQTGWRTAQFDLTDTSQTYIEGGFLFIGTRTQFDYNHSWGDGRVKVDPSIFEKPKGGQTKIKIRPPFWQWDIPMGWVTEAQKNGALEQIMLLNGRRLPVLFLMNPASTNLGRDSIFGLIQDSVPVVSLEAYDSAGGIMSSTSFKVEQRL
jgi:hypothetical protein